MTQKTAYLMAAGVTAFLLVIGGAVAAQASGLWAGGTPTAAAPAWQVQTAQTVADAAAGQYAITADQAAVIAGSAAPGAQVTKTPELVSYQGVPAYEVTLDQGLVYVDAQTGQVLGSTVPSAPLGARWGLGGEPQGGEHEGGEHHGWGGDD